MFIKLTSWLTSLGNIRTRLPKSPAHWHLIGQSDLMPMTTTTRMDNSTVATSINNKAQAPIGDSFEDLCVVCSDKAQLDHGLIEVSLDPNKKAQVHQDCFQCLACKRPLRESLQQIFVEKQAAFFCEPDYLLSQTPWCHRCYLHVIPQGPTNATRVPLRERSQIIWCKGRPYHVLCFKCRHCQTPLKGRTYNIMDGNFYCSPCSSHFHQKRWAEWTGSMEGLAQYLKDIEDPDAGNKRHFKNAINYSN